MQFKGPNLEFGLNIMLRQSNEWELCALAKLRKAWNLCKKWVECWPGTLSVRFKKHFYFSPRAEVQVLKAVQSVCLHFTKPRTCLSLLMDLSFHAPVIWSTMVCAIFWGRWREKETAGAWAEREHFYLALPSDHKYWILALKHESKAVQILPVAKVRLKRSGEILY